MSLPEVWEGIEDEAGPYEETAVRLASFTTNILAPESKKPRDIKAKDIART
jgi:hypothetical protein